MITQYLTPDSHEKLYKAAAKPLSRLTAPNNLSLNKKINTILQIVLHELAGEAWHTKQFWARQDTCSESIFYKWKRDDPDFEPILNEVRKVATTWRISNAAANVAKATIILQELAEEAAQRMGKLMRQETDLSVARLAAADILNRNQDTAPMQKTVLTDEEKHALDLLYPPEPEGQGDAAASDQELEEE